METEALFAEIDAALAAYQESIDAGLKLARTIIACCDGLDESLSDLRDAQAEVEEWMA